MNLISNLLLLASGTIHHFWYAFPLIVVISLVYSATRHEFFKPILIHALRFSAVTVVFLGIAIAVLYFLATSFLT